MDAKITAEKRSRIGAVSGIVGIALNLLLFSVKLVVGLLTGYVSITADAFNNLSDSFSSIVSFISFRIACRPADKDHPFGHERLEYASSMIVAFVVIVLSWELGVSSVKSIISPKPAETLTVVSGLVLTASVLVKLFMFFFNRNSAKKINSSLLRATATDSISDAIATSAVILCAIISPAISFNLDGYAGLVIALFIAKAGIGIIKENINSIIGKKPDEDLSKSILDYTKTFSGVLDTHDMIIHQYGPNRAFLSLHVEVDGTQNVFESHDMIDNIEMGIYKKFGVVATIHMDPIYPEDEFVLSLKAYTEAALANYNGRLSIHDFRVVHGATHTNILFDVIKPYDVKTNDKGIKQYLEDKLKELNESYNAVIVIEREFT